MNKKLLSLFAAAGIAGSIFVTPLAFAASETVPAQTQAVTQTQTRAGSGTASEAPSFIDENKDGICDNYSEGLMMRRAGSGQQGAGTGPNAENFVDEDKDGVCDNFADRTPLLKKDGTGNPSARGTGKGTGTGTGSENFVDQDKDGVCDNFADRTPLQKQDGTGRMGAGKGAGRGK